MTTQARQADLEDVYEALAAGIDAAGPEREAFYLAKVALLLAERIGDPAEVLKALREAASDPDPMRDPSGPGPG